MPYTLWIILQNFHFLRRIPRQKIKSNTKIPLMQLLSHVQFYDFIKVISLIVKCVEKFCTFIYKKQTLVKLIEIDNKVMKLDQPKFVDDANKVSSSGILESSIGSLIHCAHST